MPLLRINKHKKGRTHIRTIHPEVTVQKMQEILQRPHRDTVIGTHLSLRTIALIAYLYLKLGLSGEAVRRELGISKKAV